MYVSALLVHALQDSHLKPTTRYTACHPGNPTKVQIRGAKKGKYLQQYVSQTEK